MTTASTYLLAVCLAIFAVLLIAIAAAPVTLWEKAGVVGCAALLIAVTIAGFSSLRADAQYSVIYGTLAAYIWFAYPGKLALLIHIPERSWLVDFRIMSTVSAAEFVRAFFLVTPALVVFLLLFWVARGDVLQRVKTMPSLGPLYVLTLVAMSIAKIVLQVFFHIGVPGVSPLPVVIPGAAGLLNFMTSSLLLMLVNLYIYQAFISHSAGQRRVATLMGLILVLSDLWVGYKHALVMQVAILPFYYFAALDARRGRRRFRATVLMILVAAAGLGLFQYVNGYRFARLLGSSVSESIDSAIAGVAVGNGPVMPFINRVNGIDNFLAARIISSRFQVDFGGLLGQSLGDNFNYVVFGEAEVPTQFGLTQFGALYAAGGAAGLLLGSAAISLALRLLSNLLLSRVVTPGWFTAIAPLLALFFIKVLFAGGMWILLFKEAVVITSGLFAVRVLFERRGVAGRDALSTHSFEASSAL